MLLLLVIPINCVITYLHSLGNKRIREGRDFGKQSSLALGLESQACPFLCHLKISLISLSLSLLVCSNGH